jgi:hypothetical protein
VIHHSRVVTPWDQALAVGESLGTTLESPDQARAPPVQRFCVRCILGQIVAFLGIGCQVEELLAAVQRAPDILLLAVGEEMIGLHLAIAWGVLAVEPGTLDVSAAPENREKIFAVDALRYCNLGKRE